MRPRSRRRRVAFALVAALPAAMLPVTARAQTPPPLPGPAACARPHRVPTDARVDQITDLFARGPREAYVLADQSVLRFDGTRWAVLAEGLSPPPGATAVALWVSPQGTPWVALTTSGVAYEQHCGPPGSQCGHRDCTRVAPRSPATIPVAMRWVGGRWETVTVPAGVSLGVALPDYVAQPVTATGIDGTSDRDVWIETRLGSALRWDGRAMSAHAALPRRLAARRAARENTAGLSHPRLEIARAIRFARGAWVSGAPREDHTGSAVALLVGGRWRTFEPRVLATTTYRRSARGAMLAVSERPVGSYMPPAAHHATWDGQVFANEVVPSPRGMLGALVEGPDGTLWGFGLEGSLARRRGGAWEAIAGLASNAHVLTLAAAGPDDAWLVGDGQTLVHYHDGRFDAASAGDPARFYRLAFASERDGWALTDRGLRRWNGASWVEVTLPWPDHVGADITVTPSGELLVLAGTGPHGRYLPERVLRFDGQTWTALPSLGLRDVRPRDLWSRAPGDLWLGADTGPVAHWNGRCWERVELRATPSASTPALLEVASDRAPLEWLGGDRGVLVHRGL